MVKLKTGGTAFPPGSAAAPGPAPPASSPTHATVARKRFIGNTPRDESERLQVRDQVRQLLPGQLALALDRVGAVRPLERLFERLRPAVVQVQRPVVAVDQRRRVVALVDVAGLAGADLVYLAVGEVRPRVTAGAAGLGALE